MVHIPGTKHKTAHALLRNPTGTETPATLKLPDDVAATIEDHLAPPFTSHGHHFIIGVRPPCTTAARTPDTEERGSSSMSASLDNVSVTWDQVKKEIASDKNMEQLRSVIDTGFLTFRHLLPPQLQEYFQFRANLHTHDGVILYKDRILIPSSLRLQILPTLHCAHQGVTSMIYRADTIYFGRELHQSSKPCEIPALTATAWLHSNRMHHLHPPILSIIHFDSVPTSSTTEERITW